MRSFSGEQWELGVPIVVVKADTMRAIELVEKVLGRIRLSSQRQIDRLSELIKKKLMWTDSANSWVWANPQRGWSDGIASMHSYAHI